MFILKKRKIMCKYENKTCKYIVYLLPVFGLENNKIQTTFEGLLENLRP